VLAQNQGWYDRRQIVQLEFMLVVAGFFLAAAIAMTYWARRTKPETRIAVVGTIVLLAYIFMRAASFHHFDIYVGHRLLGLKWSWILEITGVAIVVLASCRMLLRDRVAQHRADVQKRTVTPLRSANPPPGRRDIPMSPAAVRVKNL
jgi:hypothetical protein